MKSFSSSVNLRGFLLLFLLYVSPYLQAQDVFRHPLTPQTEQAFRATCARLAQYTYIKGNFEQEKINKRLNRSLKSAGNFIIAADQGMVWDTVKPFPSTLVLSDNYMIQSRPGGKKNVMNAQGNETFIRMAEVNRAVFTGNTQGLIDNFTIYFSSNPSGDAAAWEMGLTPLDTAITAVAHTIVIKGDTVIRSILIYDQNGDSVQYRLSNHYFPAELSTHEQAFFTN